MMVSLLSTRRKCLLRWNVSTEGEALMTLKIIEEVVILWESQILELVCKNQEIILCWKKTNGYNIGINKVLQSVSMYIIQMLWAKKTFHSVGPMYRTIRHVKRDVNSFWSYNALKNITLQADRIKKHFYTLTTINLKCNKCNSMFNDEYSLEHHIKLAHNALNEVYDWNYLQNKCRNFAAIHFVLTNFQFISRI